MVDLDLTGRAFGGYQVEDLLGRGAFGWVYRARQLSLDRPVALKVLDPVVARSPDAARRFDREGRSAAALDHPAIVDVYQSGAVDGLHFLAMRMIDGIGLDRVLAHGPMPPPDLLAVLDRIGPALDHAHAAGIVHRDVKPANILLECGDPRRAWLGDFGIAVSVRAAGDVTATALGTAFYMAPEQVDPARTGPAADQYSLACVAYEALTGRRPFRGDDLVAVLMSHRTDPVPPTGTAALDAVLGKALAKTPDRRYATVTAFVAALHTALRPAAAPRSPARTRVLAGIACAVLLTAGGITTATLLSRPDGSPGPLSSPGPAATANPVPPAGWQQVQGPGPARYSVPSNWQRDATSGPVSRFQSNGEQVLLVGSDRPGTPNPVEDLRRLYDCETEPLTLPLAGGQAAACPTKGRHATVVIVAGTAIRFTFTAAVTPTTRDQILASLTVPADQG
ncbi:MAG TPA: serine/threonine-protein kinase [Actinophytocola sp.]|uniref:serine/threonine-protein kinase n=1 Tax=Actinophytocola sp. TaxID=1872138 RepID=UPI002DC017D4|nr:serine/threonine-protein kinase [Actinophytocola sp.]HEU5471239.1 serine/threonine-protein kinase [Actinophytocola sp.]